MQQSVPGTICCKNSQPGISRPGQERIDNVGLFDEQLEEIQIFYQAKENEGALRAFAAEEPPSWPEGQSLILEDDTALELGNPRIASLSFLVWSEGNGVEDGRVSLVGPDIGDAGGGSVPFAQVVMATGEFTDQYECFRDVREAVYDTRLEGFSVRTMPSRQTIWCRVGKEAMEDGLSLVDLGSALVESLKEVEFVSGAEVLFVTSSAEDVEELAPAAEGAQRKINAMMKMYEERNFDCETCEYRDVCDNVIELKKMKKQLEREKKAGGAA